jgi:hypothetical protein
LFLIELELEQGVGEQFKALGEGFQGFIQEGLTNAIKLIYGKAAKNLTGAGAIGSDIEAGGYPVPVRTGHLRWLLGLVLPDETKESEGLSFEAGSLEAIIFDSAEYADVIHEGTGTSSEYGERPYLKDAIIDTDIAFFITEAINTGKSRYGF